MKLNALVFVLLLCSMTMANGACDKQADESASYKRAVRRVEALPEYKKWRSLVSASPGVHAARLPAVDRQMTIGHHCYWSISEYSDEGTHIHRWQTFLVSQHGKRILVEDLEGTPIPLATWRAKQSKDSAR